MKELYDNLYLGLGTAIVFTLVSLWIIPEYIVMPSSVQMTGVSPSFWPKVTSWSLVVLGLILAVTSYTRLQRAKQAAGSSEQGEAGSPAVPKINPRVAVKVVVTIGAMMVYYFLVDVLGMMLSSILALFFYTLLYGEKRFKITVPVAVLVPVLLYLFFVKVANIPMPQGILGI